MRVVGFSPILEENEVGGFVGHVGCGDIAKEMVGDEGKKGKGAESEGRKGVFGVPLDERKGSSFTVSKSFGHEGAPRERRGKWTPLSVKRGGPRREIRRYRQGRGLLGRCFRTWQPSYEPRWRSS